MPKLHFGPISNLISNKFRESFPPPHKFPRSHSKGPQTSLEHQLPLKLSYLISTTDLQKASLSVVYHHNHFLRRARLNWIRFLTHNSFDFIGVQFFYQFTKWNLNSLSNPPYRKSVRSFSSLLATPTKIGKRNKNHVGCLEIVFFYQSQPASLRQIKHLSACQTMFHFLNNVGLVC
jgi:hypothetical protein